LNGDLEHKTSITRSGKRSLTQVDDDFKRFRLKFFSEIIMIHPYTYSIFHNRKEACVISLVTSEQSRCFTWLKVDEASGCGTTHSLSGFWPYNDNNWTLEIKLIAVPLGRILIKSVSYGSKFQISIKAQASVSR